MKNVNFVNIEISVYLLELVRLNEFNGEKYPQTNEELSSVFKNLSFFKGLNLNFGAYHKKLPYGSTIFQGMLELKMISKLNAAQKVDYFCEMIKGGSPNSYFGPAVEQPKSKMDQLFTAEFYLEALDHVERLQLNTKRQGL